MLDFSFSYGYVALAALANFVIGALWYSPLLFGNIWAKWMGMKTDGKMGGDMIVRMVLNYLSTLVLIWFLAALMESLTVTEMSEALLLTFYVWFGVSVPTSLNSVLWGGKSVKLYLLENAGFLIGLLVSGVIVFLWA